MRKAVLIALALVFASLIGTGVYLISINHPTIVPKVVTTTITPEPGLISVNLLSDDWVYIPYPMDLNVTNSTKITDIGALFNTTTVTTTTIFVTQPPPTYASLWPIFLAIGIVGIVGLSFRAVKRK